MIKDPAETIDLEKLAAVTGGMQWEQMRPSENVEDRRGDSPREARHRPAVAPVAPLPPVARTPGDLPSQAGLDDLARLGSRRRR